MGLVNNGKIVAGAAPSSGGFEYPFPIDYAGKFDGSSAYLYRLAGDNPANTDRKNMVISLWVKRASLGSYQELVQDYYDGNSFGQLLFNNDDTIKISAHQSGGTQMSLTTAAVFRDTSHWMHVYVKLDTTQATAADRVQIYVNGVQQTLTGTFPSANNDYCSLLRQNFQHRIGAYSTNTYYQDGYIAEIHAFDGSLPALSEFGEFVGNTWVPKRYVGSEAYGADGWYFDFETPGEDVSGNGRDFTNSNVVQTIDTPTNNFPTFDPLWSVTAGGRGNAGLQLITGTSATYMFPMTVPIPKTGKWRMQYQSTSTYAARAMFGAMTELAGGSSPYSTVEAVAYFGYSGVIYADGVAATTEATFTTDDYVDVIFDSDNMEVSFYLNGVFQATVSPTSYTGQDWFFAAGDGSTSYAVTIEMENGANGDWEYTLTGVGADALPICTANIPQPAVIDGAEGFWAETFVGNETERDITGSSFDLSRRSLIWLKDRDEAYHHQWYDTVRGANKVIYSSLTNVEFTTDDAISAFLTNGYTVGDNIYINGSGSNIISWVFNMLPDYGMDIVAYTGTGVVHTVDHNLGAAPELMILKGLDSATGWAVYCKYVADTNPAYYYLSLQSVNARLDESYALWNATEPTSSVFTLGAGGTNNNGEDYIAYLFSSIPGFLKVGYYIGNGSADGPRIYTGFRPRFLIVKCADSNGSWIEYDSVRDEANVLATYLVPNLAQAETSSAGYTVDFLSNGFKLRGLGGSFNASSDRIIYIAIAESAFPYANAF